MYGEPNKTLSYLPDLASKGVVLAEIPHGGHFPMYSNAPEMWRRIAAFQAQATEIAGHSVTSRTCFQSAPPAASGVPEP